MITYLKLSIKKHYVEYDEPLDSELFNIGSTWEDYLSNKWIPLSEDQIAFRESNPRASIKEVIDMELVPEPEPYTPSLEEAKDMKIHEIQMYDTSDAVNSFYLNNERVWLDKATRVGLMNSLNVEKNYGKEESTLWLNNTKIVINIDAAIQMLSALELYALECYNVTADHINTVMNLTDASEVEDFDFTVNYPDKLEFTI